MPDRTTIMTIRVKKANALALEENRMSQDQFAQAAEVTCYPGPVIVEGAGGVNSRFTVGPDWLDRYPPGHEKLH